MEEIEASKHAIKDIQSIEKKYKDKLTKEDLSYLIIHLNFELDTLKQPFIITAGLSFTAFVFGLMITQVFKENSWIMLLILSVIFLSLLGHLGWKYHTRLKHYTLRKHITEKILCEVEQKEPSE
ncbi:hypothetical protein MKX70_23990 [Paenibacillus sp. FSL R7-0312]|uniref:hypothetical protein n=1 Tax=Paenibacillus sp. FSL R7-0312 TaxID=2921682 RepID=UPI0030F88FA9